jgi:hypothetical protein
LCLMPDGSLIMEMKPKSTYGSPNEVPNCRYLKKSAKKILETITCAIKMKTKRDIIDDKELYATWEKGVGKCVRLVQHNIKTEYIINKLPNDKIQPKFRIRLKMCDIVRRFENYKK